MATQNADNDDLLLAAADVAVNQLQERYWGEKARGTASFDVIFDLRSVYEDAVIELGRLKIRILRDDILATGINLTQIAAIQKSMKKAKDNKEFLSRQ